jgi:hypothetical protein
MPTRINTKFISIYFRSSRIFLWIFEVAPIFWDLNGGNKNEKKKWLKDHGGHVQPARPWPA